MSVKVIDSFRIIQFIKNASLEGQVVADADNDTLTMIGGPGVNFIVDENTDSVTLSLQSAEEIVASALGRVEIRADDSTVRIVQGGENFGILGDGGVASTASSAEGDITISVDTDLSNYNNTTTAFISDITGESIGDLSDVTLSSIGDGELLQWSSGEFINRTITEAGFAAVSTSGVYSDLTSRPNITFDGDLSGNSGGALAGGAQTITLTLDNVNSNVGTFNTVTVNAKGLVTAASNVNFATVATTGSYNDLTDLPSLAGTYKFNIAADDSTEEQINSDETIQIVGANSITTSLTDGVITVTGPANLSDLSNDLTLSSFANDTGYITLVDLPDTFNFKVGADDSTARNVSLGEQINFVGGGDVTTASDAEGNITISFTQDTAFSSLTGTPTTLSGYGIIDAATSAQGALADSAIQPGDNVSTLTNDAGYVTDADLKFNIAADDSTLRQIGNDETIQFLGGGDITTSSDPEGNITISYTQPTNITAFTNDAGYITAAEVGQTYSWRIGADDSTMRDVNAGEDVKILGGTAITTSSDAEGNITVTGVAQDFAFSSLTGVPTTVAGYGITDAYTKAQVDSAIAGVVDSAPEQLNTLNELAAALNDDGNFATTVTNRFTAIENNVFNIGADDSTMRSVARGENVKVLGGTAITTSSDAEGNITVDFVNPGYITNGLQIGDNVSNLVNDAGYFTRLFVAGDDSTVRTLVKDETIQFQGTGSTTTTTDADGNVIIDSGNETITLFGDVTGSGTTSINVTLADSPVASGTYNKVTVDTKGIVQSAELIDYLQDGDGVSRLYNDAGYLTLENAINFNISGDDSTGFNVVGGNTIQFTGAGGITVTATDSPTEVVTIDGSGLVEIGDNITSLVNNAGYYSAGSHMVGDLQGSVFADDSTMILNGETGTLHGRVQGDLTGSVYADDSTQVIDGVAGTVSTSALDQYEENQTWSPVVTPGSGSFNAVTATGRYTRIGKMCYAWFEITLTDVGTGTGSLDVGGLPFTSSNEQDVQIGAIREAAVTGKMAQFVVNPNGTSGYIQDVTGAGGSSVMTNSYRWTGGVTYQIA